MDTRRMCKSPVGRRKCKSPTGKRKCTSPASRSINKNPKEYIDNFSIEDFALPYEDKIDFNIGMEENLQIKTAVKYLADDLESGRKGPFNKEHHTEDRLLLIPEQKEIDSDRKEKPEKQKSPSKDSNKMNLSDMERKLLEKVTIIQYEKNLYYYTGRTYKIIENSSELLRIVRSKVSNSGFNCNSIKWVQDLFAFMVADDNLVPEDCMKKLSIASLYVVFRNGVLDLRTLKLMKHSKEYLTFYELDARWTENIRAKVFEKFVIEISDNERSIGIRILEAIGYLLSPYNQGKKFFVMGTAHDSGKSTIGELLERLIGSENVAHLSTYQLGNRFSLGNTHGKILNLSMDLPKGKLDRVAASIIKMASGGDKIATEQKYERMKEIHSNMRFLFASNYPVTISKEDDDDAFWERMIVIPFIHSIDESKRNIYLIDELLQEKEGIIYMCLTTFHNMLKRNGQFSPCGVAEEMKSQWRYGEDNDLSYTIRQFIQDCIDITGKMSDDIFSKDLYKKYECYCTENQFPIMSYSKILKWCGENLEDCEKCRIHHEAKENPKSGFKGMRWK